MKESFERLIQSVKAGNIDGFNSIIESNPSVLNEVDQDGCNIMHYAANYKEADIFTSLARRDNSLISKVNNHNITPLVTCLIQMGKEDNFELTEFLLTSFQTELEEALKVIDSGSDNKSIEINIFNLSTAHVASSDSSFVSLAEATSIEIFQYFIGESITSKERLDSWVANVQEWMKDNNAKEI